MVLICAWGPKNVITIQEHKDFNYLGKKVVYGTPGTPWFWLHWQYISWHQKWYDFYKKWFLLVIGGQILPSPSRSTMISPSRNTTILTILAKGGLWHPRNTMILTILANESLSTKNEMIFIKKGSCWWLGAKYCHPRPGTPGFWQLGQNNAYCTPWTPQFRQHWQMCLQASKMTLVLSKLSLFGDWGQNIVVAIQEHNDTNNLSKSLFMAPREHHDFENIGRYISQNQKWHDIYKKWFLLMFGDQTFSFPSRNTTVLTFWAKTLFLEPWFW